MNEETKEAEPLISVVGMNPYLTQIQTICMTAMNCRNFKYNEELYCWAHSMIGIIIHKCDLTDVFEVIRNECDNILAIRIEYEKVNPDMLKYARDIKVVALDGDAAMKRHILGSDAAKMEDTRHQVLEGIIRSSLQMQGKGIRPDC